MSAPPPLPGKRRNRILFWLLLLIALSIPASFIAWRIIISGKVRARLAALHEAGYPISLPELEHKYYPAIKPEENAAFFFESAFAQLKISNTGNGSFLTKITSKQSQPAAPFSLEETNKITQLLAENREALEMLHHIPQATNCRYPLVFSDGYQMLMPHLPKLKVCGKLLALEAAWHGETGDVAAAVADLEAELHLSRSLMEEPTLVSQLVRMDCDAAAVSSIERILNRQRLSDTQLTWLGRELQIAESPLGMEHATVGEYCCGADMFQMSGDSLAAVIGGLGGDPASDPASTSLGFKVMKLSGFSARDFNFYITIMSQHLMASKLPFPQKLEAGDAINDRVTKSARSGFHLLSAMLLPAFGKYYFREATMVASLHVSQTVLAIERYRIAHQNNLPESLSDLIPTLLPSVPMDPFDGKPLRYKKLTKGYVVYSIGKDGKNDGGLPPKTATGPGDITFTVER